jgi:hypothetical protein
MKRMTPPKNLGKALEQGYQPMFMTGPEIKEHFKMWPGDREGQSESDAWNRKLRESKETGENSARYGVGNPRLKGMSRVTREGQALGVTPRSTLKKVMEKQGGTHGIISLESRMVWSGPHQGQHSPFPSHILGGHHRVALSAEQFKDALHPIQYHSGMMDAQYDPNYK